MDRHHEKKTALLVDSLRRCGGAESVLIFHKLTQEERACSCMLSLLISFFFPSSLSLPVSLPLSSNSSRYITHWDGVLFFPAHKPKAPNTCLCQTWGL